LRIHLSICYSNCVSLTVCISSHQDKQRASFADFVRSLLTIDPDKRPTAAEALNHTWIKSSLDLTEDDIRYQG
jgi:serine/threonine protein kinase